jgi:Ca2+-binding EF-hand superfamily protein
LFTKSLHTERANECLRARLNRRPKFSLREAFFFLDKNKNGQVSMDEVRVVLSDHGYCATDRELQYIFDKFDKDRDLRISFKEFVNEMTPKLGA